MWIKHNKVLLSKMLLLLVILLLSGLTTSGCVEGLQPIGWSGGIVADGSLFLGSIEGRLVAVDTSDGTRQWSDQITTTTPGGFGCTTSTTGVAIYGTPAVAEDLVYVGAYNGKIYAFDSSSLQKRWVYPPEGNLQPIVSGPVVALDKVYFGGSDGRVYALDANTGVEVWESFSTGDKIWSTPVVDNGTVYVTSFDKKLYALNATTGEKKWETTEAGGAIAATPLVHNSTVYFGSFDRYLYAVDATDGSLKWKSEVEAGSWFWAKPVIYNNTIYAPSLDGKVYILDTESGHELVDAIDLGAPVSSSPVVVDGLIIIASEVGQIYSLDTANNQKKLLNNVVKDEKRERVDAPLSSSNGVVYIHVHSQETDTLYKLDTQTGVESWQISLVSESK
ncbi:PQQ-binding-like beta-propeller repeat protein [Chloroflexota bacterium]